MRNSSYQLTKDYIHDSKEFIEGNVADYLIEDFQAVSSYYEYMTDEEIYEYDNADMSRRYEIENEIENWIRENFDFDISEFDY